MKQRRFLVTIEELDDTDQAKPADQAPPAAEPPDQARAGWFEQLDDRKRRARREAAREDTP